MGFKDRVMVLLRPSKGGGVEDLYKLTNLVPRAFPFKREKPWERGCKLTKGRSVNCFHVLHLCKTWNFCTFSTKAHFFVKMAQNCHTAAILDCPLRFPAVL